MEDDVFDDSESVLPHRQAVGYPVLITPGGACYHFLRRSDVPEIHSHTSAERQKASTFTMNLGPVPLNRRDLDTVFGNPEARAVMVFASEIVGSKDIPVHTCNASAAICQVNKWLLDTGAGQHLVPKKCVPQGAIFQSSKIMRLRTANGVIETSDRCWVEVPGLDHHVEAIVLPHGEAALSVGRLIMQGFGFRWDPEDLIPIMSTKEGKKAFVWCEHHTPYVSGDAFLTIDDTPANTGVVIPEGACLVPPGPVNASEKPTPDQQVPPPPAPLDAYEEEEDVDVRPKDRDPLSLSHLMTHFPFNPKCEICVRSNKKRAAHKRRKGPIENEAKKFGG